MLSLRDMCTRETRYVEFIGDLSFRGLQSNVQRSFVHALDVSQGMPDICQETPRDGYGSRSDRSSVDRYGFPSAHSTSSSIPSTYNFSSYGGSVSDPSTASSDVKPVNSRALLQLQGLMASEVPPTPQSLMGQFRSKVSSRPQKRHKCKVCDKLFTRPSSLQTHMYSHTGERHIQLLPVRSRGVADTSLWSPISGDTEKFIGATLVLK
ncbi:hypothetical protein FALCPG4_015783 [Fusarium falciforme]